jgi:hypothetical protein
MRRFSTICALVPAIAAPALLAISYLTPLRASNGRIQSPPFTSVMLTRGELRLDQLVYLNAPITNPDITYGGRWGLFWKRLDVPRAELNPEDMGMFPKDGCCGMGFPYDDLFLSSAFRPMNGLTNLRDVSFRSVRAPFWPVTILTSIYPIFLLRMAIRTRIRQRRGLCIPCGYNLTGNTSGICPECGTAISPTSP